MKILIHRKRRFFTIRRWFFTRKWWFFNRKWWFFYWNKEKWFWGDQTAGCLSLAGLVCTRSSARSLSTSRKRVLVVWNETRTARCSVAATRNPPAQLDVQGDRAVKMMNFVLWVIHFVFKIMDFVLKIWWIACALQGICGCFIRKWVKMMNFVSKTGNCVSKNEKLCIKNEEFLH